MCPSLATLTPIAVAMPPARSRAAARVALLAYTKRIANFILGRGQDLRYRKKPIFAMRVTAQTPDSISVSLPASPSHWPTGGHLASWM
jgi:hypothetical protein